jgi:anaerobic dimethyl sulfoxide reductase subunit C (anchor subunit)
VGTWEWPLIIFTVLSQTAIGILLALWWLDRSPLDADLFKRATLAAGILLVVALVVSLFDLGHPELAYRAVSHLSSSWLSREILLFSLAFVAWLYLFFQTYQGTGILGSLHLPSGNRRLITGIAGFLGLVGIVSSAMIYVLPRVPAWDGVQTPIFFLLTAGILGALSLLVMGRQSLTPDQVTGLLYWITACVGASLLAFVIYLSMLNATSPEGMATVQYLSCSPLFWIRVVTNWLAPLVLLYLVLKDKKVFNPSLLLTLLVVSGIGELLGRALFYVSAVGIHISALK